MKIVSAEEAVKVIKTNDRIHIHAIGCAPQKLIQAMCERGRRKEFKNVRIQHLHTEGPAPYTAPEFEGVFLLESFFAGANVRKDTQAGYADYIPGFLQDTQRLIREGYCRPNVALIQTTPPDKHGFVSLGCSVDATLAAIETADTVIATINPRMPRSFGDALIPMDMIDIFTEDDTPLIEGHFAEPSPEEAQIGKYVAELIEDGATLQMGIGSIPNAVLSQLNNHKDLGIHTEMFADGVLNLVRKGIINGRNKAIDKGKIVSTFVMGSKDVYDFLDDNPGVAMMDVGYTNNEFIIAKNPKVTASLSPGGKAIIAMQSVTNRGISKIAPVLASGAGVVTTRAHVQWIVTEYGAVNLYGKTMQERAKMLISIAHPDHREELDRAAFERFGPHYHYVGA